jgi:hypothetical protein
MAAGRQGKRGAIGPAWKASEIGLISDRVSEIHDAVFGNGSPSQSIIASIVRVEAATEALTKIADKNASGIGALTANVQALTTSVDAHHKTTHLAALLGSLKFWGYALLVFVGVNLLIDVGHPLVVALIHAWTGVVIP